MLSYGKAQEIFRIGYEYTLGLADKLIALRDSVPDQVERRPQ
jgi:hypothetical protein